MRKSTKKAIEKDPSLTLTRRGVCYDLSFTPYNRTFYYENDEGINFRFSSQYHLDKFLKSYKEKRKSMTSFFVKKLNMNVNFDMIIDVITYSKIETRGFCIMYKGEVITCQQNIDLIGTLKIQRN